MAEEKKHEQWKEWQKKAEDKEIKHHEKVENSEKKHEHPDGKKRACCC